MAQIRIRREQFCQAAGGKVRHPTEAAAKVDAAQATRRDPAKRPRYVYPCEACGDWHTSRYREYRPRVSDGTQPRELPGWQLAWERAARGEVVTSWPSTT